MYARSFCRFVSATRTLRLKTMPESEMRATSWCRRRCRRSCCRPVLHRQTDADRRGHRLLDQVNLARAGMNGGFFHRPLFHFGDARGNRDDHPRARRRLCVDLRMKWRSIASVTSKSAMTPSFIGRMATMLAGVRPSMRLASSPTARTLVVPAWTATTEVRAGRCPDP